jgi:SPP1 family predicted phage head-tail adaptor
MKKSDVAYLVSESWTQDNTGVQRRSTEKRKVFVKVSSVNSHEWFEGGRNGLNPQYRFTMFSFDYNNEKIIEYQGKQYTIYRTYFRSADEIELYVELRKGNE